MERYVDGFLLPIPKDKVGEYREIAAQAGAIWKEHGALEYRECVAEDLDPKGMVSFARSAGASEDETVLFSWVAYESREHRDRVNAAVMADPRIQALMEAGGRSFDYARMAYGGFTTLVAL